MPASTGGQETIAIASAMPTTQRLQPRGVITWDASKLETARAVKPGGDCMSRLDLGRAPGVRALLVVGASLGLVLSALPPVAAQTSNDILTPSGYQINQFASGFTSATAFDRLPNGDFYVLDSGANFGYPQGAQPPSVKVWKVSNGTPSLVYNGDNQTALVGPGLGIAVKDDDTIFVKVTGRRYGIPGTEVELDPAVETASRLVKVCYASCKDILTREQSLILRTVGVLSSASSNPLQR